MSQNEQTIELPEFHYLVVRGLLDNGRDPEDRTRRLVWSKGKVLPYDIGAIEARTNPHCVQMVPGYKEPDPPDSALSSPPASQDAAKQEGMLNETDIAAIADVMARTERADVARAAQHDREVGPEAVAARDAASPPPDPKPEPPKPRRKPGPKPGAKAAKAAAKKPAAKTGAE